MVRSINDRFTATMTNNVRWQDAPSCSADARCDGHNPQTSLCGSLRMEVTARRTAYCCTLQRNCMHPSVLD